MSLKARIAKLEAAEPERQCPHCDPTIWLAEEEQQPDGTWRQRGEWPKACAACGKLPFGVVVLMHHPDIPMPRGPAPFVEVAE